MTHVAFVDANIPIYAAGRDHKYKEPCARITKAIANNPAHFMTDAEVLQELMHHFLRTNRRAAGRVIFPIFETLLRGRIEPACAEDVSMAALMVDQGNRLKSRDDVRASAMRRYGTGLCISVDSDFDRIPGVRRLDPMQLPMQLEDWQPDLGVTAPPSRDVLE